MLLPIPITTGFLLVCNTSSDYENRMTAKWDTDLLIMNNKEVDKTMKMYQAEDKIEETKHPSLTKTFPHKKIIRIVYKITCSPTTDVNCPITEVWYVTLGFAVQLQA